MADRSKIEWTDATWNPITGCSVVSPGCTNCYAMKLAGTRLQHHPSRAGLTTMSKAGPVWNGQVRLNEEWLLQPLHWKAPRRIFVCAHGDLFHEGVPDEWIDRVFAVMALAPQHTFQVLTKRSKRMRSYLSSTGGGNRSDLRNQVAFVATPSVLHQWCPTWKSEDIDGPHRSRGIAACEQWPLPNVWLGVSTEDQQRANERIPDLLATTAAVRFISAEPMLEAIDLIKTVYNDHTGYSHKGFLRDRSEPDDYRFHSPKIDWVIVGGESGFGARPMHPDWARSLREQCVAAGVPLFFKQWGEWGPVAVEADGTYEYDSEVRLVSPAGHSVDHADIDRCDFPDNSLLMERRGKARAGRLLDGVEHNGMPEVRHG